MKLECKLTGTRLNSHKTHITWRDTTNFVAAIQDGNSLYFDDRAKQGIFAPPTFLVAVT